MVAAESHLAAPNGIISTASNDLQNSYLGWVVLLIVGAVTLILATRYGSSQPRRKLPPGPRNWPLLGAMAEMEPRLHRAFERLAGQYGPIVYFQLGVQKVVLVSSPEAAEEVLKYKDAEFADREAGMTRLAGKYTKILDTPGLVFSNNDDDVKLQRKFLMTEFLNGAKLKTYEALRGKEMAAMVEKVFSQIESSNNNIVNDNDEGPPSQCIVGIRGLAFSLTQNVFFKLLIGKRFDDFQPTDEIRKWPQLLDDTFDILMKFNMVDFFPVLERLDPQGVVKDLKKLEKRIVESSENLFQNYRQMRKQLKCDPEILVNESDHIRRNFLDVLVRTQEEGGEVSDRLLKLSTQSVFFAGIHTTACQLEWALLELARHPKVLQRLRDEIDQVVGKERPVQEADLQAMPFLNAVVMESLRLRSVTPFSFPHVNMEPSTLGGYYIPPKTAVLVNIRTIGRDPKIWDDPLQFNPDRFMEGKSNPAEPALSSKAFNPAGGSNYDFLSFGSGRRICPGAGLAMILLLRSIATLVHAFELGPPPGRSAESLNVEESISFVLHPIDEVFLTSRPRLPRHVYQGSLLA